jgi:hypothetical protein
MGKSFIIDSQSHFMSGGGKKITDGQVRLYQFNKAKRNKIDTLDLSIT